MKDVIRTLEQELDATQQRCGQLERMIRDMREIFNIPEGAEDEDEEAPAAGNGKSKLKKAATAKVDAVRHKSADEVHRERYEAIVATLQKHGPVMKPGELARRLGYNNTTAMNYYVKPLVKAKRVVFHGAGGARLIGLPGSKPAKEGL